MIIPPPADFYLQGKERRYKTGVIQGIGCIVEKLRRGEMSSDKFEEARALAAEAA